MNLIHKLSPKRLFPSKKTRSVTRSEPPSFGSGSSSSSSSPSSSDDHPSVHQRSEPKIPAGEDTPRSVLPPSATGDDVRHELVQAFRLIDRDGDGKITAEELSGLLRRVAPEPPSESELAAMLSEVDGDGDGSISLEEFGAIAEAFRPASGESELRGVFDVFDRDHDGKITAEELLLVFEAIGDDWCTIADCRRMIDGVNKAGDGFVCFEDFTRMMKQPR